MPLSIRTKFLPATDTKGARIKAWTDNGHTVTISYPHAGNEPSHRAALDALLAKFPALRGSEYIGGDIPGDSGYLFVPDSGTLQALRRLARVFQDGRNYDTKNPYARPEVREALEAIKAATGFEGDWMDANPYAASEPAY